ncbi:MAG: DUF3570 domain-containing protein [Methylococcales bacterium]|nr:DUF3570 domain-containing protein [Methylococcales bacterium]
MAVIKPETGKALAALTSAALSLPGLSAQAAVVSNDILSNVSYGHYQESSNRISVDIYHADALIPLTERIELSFSLDRDTYGGASPAFSMPETMANQPKISASQIISADIVSSASPVASAAMLTTMGLADFVAYQESSAAAQASVNATDSQQRALIAINYHNDITNDIATMNAFNLGSIDKATNNPTTLALTSLLDNTAGSQATVCSVLDKNCEQAELARITSQYQTNQSVIEQFYNKQASGYSVELTVDYNNLAAAQANFSTWQAQNPQPLMLINTSTDPNASELINFSGLVRSSYGGASNTSSPCNSVRCYFEGGMEFGSVYLDGTEHIHVGGGLVAGSNHSILSSSDSTGVYMRATNGAAFSLQSILLNETFTSSSGNNPMYGANPTYNSFGTIQPQVGATAPGPQEKWEILGFNTAVNPNLSSGDGTNYPNVIAYQTVANGFTGVLTLNSAFQDVNAVWIHYFGYPGIPQNGINFALNIGDVVVGNASSTNAWINASNGYQATINNLQATYDTLLQSLQQGSSSISQAISQLLQDKNNAINTLQAQYNTALSQYGSATSAEISALSTQMQTVNALTDQAGIAAYRQVLDSMIPTGTPTVQKFQTMPQETRSQPQVNVKYYFDDYTLGVSGGLSDEPDFLSNFGALNLSHEFNNKLTTITGGYGVSSNTISRNTSSMTMAGMGGMNAAQYGPTQYPALHASSLYNSFSAGLSQVLSKNTVFQSSINYTNQNGYLSNPYKDVYIRGVITPEQYYAMSVDNASTDWSAITNLQVVGIELFRENRPTQRNIWSISNQLNHFIEEFDATLHFDYRFYIDDWGINSHTFSMKWFQALPGGIVVTPSIRYYSQSQADFFAPYFLAPRSDGFYSSDYRLSAFGDLSGGIAISKLFAKGVKLDASFEYVTHAGGLKLGGGGTGSYADFNYYIAHANLSVDLSAKLFSAGGSDDGGHAMHHEHGAALPAGVMFGHMMKQSGDMMAGFRYMYSGQDGKMLNGASAVSDQTVVSKACGNVVGGCLYRPTSMSMQMYMLDIMYAPTSWLNLMVMPQLMSMDMTMSQSLTGFEDPMMAMSGMRMTTNNLGDTIIMALVKGLDKNGHHIHAGIGVSAPTGTAKQMIGDMSQDYGMQTGSGTWDFKPSLTYTGQEKDWGWGAQLSGVKHLGINRYGYALGDVFQATGWGSYQILNWLSASVRMLYTAQGSIQGQTNLPQMTSSSVNYPSNYGGRFLDTGLGLNVSIHDGKFANHSLSFEWLQPVMTDYNGYQLDRSGALAATWHYSF